MKNRIHRSALSFALLSLIVACEKGAPRNDTTTSPAAESGKSMEPNPALTPASGERAEPAKKLAVQVVTGSEEGFLVNSTIVTGEKDAVLIDAQFTLADAKKVADAVAATGKTLTTVYVTHAHPDHYFGFPAIQERFPSARLMALPQTIADIEKTWQAKVKQWQPTYKDKITSKPVIPEALAQNSIDLDGQKLEIVGAQQGDSADNSYVWIPSLRLVVTGDIVYDGVFPWTAETTPEGRKAWSGTLDKLAALNPEQVIPGHQKPDRMRNPSSIKFTKDYLTAFDEALGESKNSAELQAKIKAKYSDLSLPVIVKIGSDAAFQKTKGQPGDKMHATEKSSQSTGKMPATNTSTPSQKNPK